MTKPFLPNIREWINITASRFNDTSDIESEFQKIRDAVKWIENIGCTGPLTEDPYAKCIDSPNETSCAFCHLKEKGII